MQDYLTAAVAADPLAAAPRRSLARLRELQHDLVGAEELFLQALELGAGGPADEATLRMYANFLEHSAQAAPEAALLRSKLQTVA